MSTGVCWTGPPELAAKLKRLWTRGRLLAARIAPEPPLFPLPLRLSRPDTRALAEQFEDVRTWIRTLEEGSKAVRGYGYEITWEDINHRQLGRNRVPASVIVPCEDDALALIGKRRQAERFKLLADRSLALFPALAGWLAKHPFVVLEHASDWERVLAVLAWLRDYPRPGIYLRQLEIPGVDSKYIEARKGLFTELLDLVLPADAINPAMSGTRQFELRYGMSPKPPLIRFRLLDPGQRHFGPLFDVATPASQFAQLELPVERVFITENEVNGLAFPSMSDSIVIFGLGYRLECLGEVEWLHRKTVHYWGDIDTHGFAILDRLRGFLPTARSFLMDRETLLAHQALWTREDAPHDGTLTRLTEAEHSVYDELKANRLGEAVRLEQERIAFGWVKQALSLR